MIHTYPCSVCGMQTAPNVPHACMGALTPPVTMTSVGTTVAIGAHAVVHVVDIYYVPHVRSGDRVARCSCLLRSRPTTFALAERWAREHLAPYGQRERPAPATSR